MKRITEARREGKKRSDEENIRKLPRGSTAKKRAAHPDSEYFIEPPEGVDINKLRTPKPFPRGAERKGVADYGEVEYTQRAPYRGTGPGPEKDFSAGPSPIHTNTPYALEIERDYELDDQAAYAMEAEGVSISTENIEILKKYLDKANTYPDNKKGMRLDKISGMAEQVLEVVNEVEGTELFLPKPFLNPGDEQHGLQGKAGKTLWTKLILGVPSDSKWKFEPVNNAFIMVYLNPVKTDKYNRKFYTYTFELGTDYKSREI